MLEEDKVSRQELMRTLDQAARYLALLDREAQRRHWLAYFLEGLEARAGIEAVENVYDVLGLRFVVGHW